MFDRWVEKDYPEQIKRGLTSREVLELLANKLELFDGYAT
jgi:hypothetical protein